MARARNIKPGFFANEELVELEFSTRLLFIGLWTIADREGRLEDKPKRIKMALFPADNLDVDQALTDLEQHGFILRYEVEGTQYIQILAFSKHQNPHKDEKKSVIPAPCEHHASTVQEHGKHSFNPADSLIPDSLIPEKEATASMSESSDSDQPEAVESKEKRNAIPYQAIVDLYHKHLPTCPRVEVITATRKGQISARWKSGELDTIGSWGEFFDYCAKSKFLIGASDPSPGRKRFVADLEWLTKESNYAKIVEGKYHG
jgi:hypothetical protein